MKEKKALREFLIRSRDEKIAKPAYNALIINREMAGNDLFYKLQNTAFGETLRAIAQENKGNSKVTYVKRERTYYFNQDPHDTAYRICISPRIAESPAEVLKIFRHALATSGKDQVSYKVFEVLGRHDQIIIYLTPVEMADFGTTIEQFKRDCPPEYLAAESLASGLPIGPGISVGMEPVELKAITETNKNILPPNKIGQFPYNGLIAYALTLAYSLAYHHHFGNERKSDYQLEELEIPAYQYFEQILKIAEIRPETMMSESTKEVNIPDWIRSYIGL